MRLNQQSEPPHIYTYEPLSRNPGSTPARIVDVSCDDYSKLEQTHAF